MEPTETSHWWDGFPKVGPNSLLKLFWILGQLAQIVMLYEVMTTGVPSKNSGMSYRIRGGASLISRCLDPRSASRTSRGGPFHIILDNHRPSFEQKLRNAGDRMRFFDRAESLNSWKVDFGKGVSAPYCISQEEYSFPIHVRTVDFKSCWDYWKYPSLSTG